MKLTQARSSTTMIVSPLSRTPRPSAPPAQCSTAEPSKCPPTRSTLTRATRSPPPRPPRPVPHRRAVEVSADAEHGHPRHRLDLLVEQGHARRRPLDPPLV